MTAARGIPEAHKERWAQLKEEFKASASQYPRARWWSKLSLEHRRTLAILAGVNDDDRTVGRAWQSISQQNRDALVNTGREWARLLEPVRYG